jgi:hypothetical protein
MKKIPSILLLTFLLSSCASLADVTGLLRTPTPVPIVNTRTPTPSITPAPTQNLFATSTPTPLTFTPTVTQIGAENFTPTGTVTDEPTTYPLYPYPTPGLPPGASSDTYFTPVTPGFLAVLLSNSQMYWNNGPCEPRELKFSAFVEDTANTDQVLLFTRLREKSDTLLSTDWNSGAIMTKADNGSFNYTLHTWNLDQYYWFKNAWLEYQLVSLDKESHVIARTPVYDHNASLVMCHPLQ